MRKQSYIRITCKRCMPHNHQYADKLISRIEHDTLSVWCRYCKKAHPVTKEQCMDVWNNDKLAMLTITCNIVDPHKTHGERVEKDIAYVYFWGARVWCMHCDQLHTISKDRCLRAWEQLRVETMEQR